MGCCWSDDQDKDDDSNDQIRPLINPIGQDGPTNRPISGYGSTVDRQPERGDEQSALNRILQQTASNVIDVAALDTHGMDPHEYQDRARQYNQRLQSWCSTTHRLRVHLPVGVAAPQAILSAQPISLADVQLITAATLQASKLIKEVKVKHKEDLVVPFGVP